MRKFLLGWSRTKSLCQIALSRRGRLEEQSLILLVTHRHRDLSAQRCTLGIRVCRSETGHALVVVHAIARLIVFRLFRHCGIVFLEARRCGINRNARDHFVLVTKEMSS